MPVSARFVNAKGNLLKKVNQMWGPQPSGSVRAARVLVHVHTGLQLKVEDTVM